MDLTGFTTVAGAVVVVAIIVEVVKRAWNPPAAAADRFLPIVSILVGVLTVIVADFGLGLFGASNWVQAVFTGIFAGAAASGVYDTVNSGGKIAGG